MAAPGAIKHTTISGVYVIKKHWLRGLLSHVHIKISGTHTVKKLWLRGILSHFMYKVTHTKNKLYIRH